MSLKKEERGRFLNVSDLYQIFLFGIQSFIQSRHSIKGYVDDGLSLSLSRYDTVTINAGASVSFSFYS